MKRLIQILSSVAILSGFIACSSDYGDEGNYTPPPATPVIVTFNAALNGASEVPSNGSAATGSAVLNYNKTTKIFTLSVTYTGITPTSAHIHKGAAGADGAVVFPISDLTSPMDFTSTALSSAQEADLLANLYYLNLHTSAFPEGEIRGQLITTNPSGEGGGY